MVKAKYSHISDDQKSHDKDILFSLATDFQLCIETIRRLRTRRQCQRKDFRSSTQLASECREGEGLSMGTTTSIESSFPSIPAASARCRFLFPFMHCYSELLLPLRHPTSKNHEDRLPGHTRSSIVHGRVRSITSDLGITQGR